MQVLSIEVHYRPRSCRVVILCVNIYGIMVRTAVCDIIKLVRDFEEVKYSVVLVKPRHLYHSHMPKST